MCARLFLTVLGCTSCIIDPADWPFGAAGQEAVATAADETGTALDGPGEGSVTLGSHGDGAATATTGKLDGGGDSGASTQSTTAGGEDVGDATSGTTASDSMESASASTEDDGGESGASDDVSADTNTQTDTDTGDDGDTEGTGTDGTGESGDDAADETSTGDDQSSTAEDGDDALLVELQDIDPSEFFGTGGKLRQQSCSDGELLIGLEGYYDSDSLQGVRSVCGRPEYEPGEPTLVLAHTTNLGLLGRGRGDPWVRSCPINEAVIGLEISATNDAIPYFRLNCASIEVRDDDDGLDLSNGTLSDAVGVTNLIKVDASCGRLGVGAGVRVNLDANVRAFGLLCRRPRLVPQ